MTRWLRPAAIVVLLVSAAVPTQTQPKRPITDTDLLKFVWAADPQVSPDGTQVVFVRVVVNEKSDDYDTNLMIVPADGREADLSPAEESDREKVAQHIGVRYSVDREELVRAGAEENRSVDWWWYLLVGLVGLLCLEVWMTRRLVMKR